MLVCGTDTQSYEVVNVTKLGRCHAATRLEVYDRSAPSRARRRRLFPNAKHEDVLFPGSSHSPI
jgi:hypothetical protein